MTGFFRGWKRKVGAAVLVVACVFGMAWVRSVSIDDYACALNYSFWSSHGRFYVGRKFSLDMRSSAWDSGEGLFPPEMEFDAVGIPYSVITIPLAAISAWLLLSKPRTTNVN